MVFFLSPHKIYRPRLIFGVCYSPENIKNKLKSNEETALIFVSVPNEPYGTVDDTIQGNRTVYLRYVYSKSTREKDIIEIK